MGDLNSLFAGLSGLDANQSRLNVIGNNIANANTIAFQSARSLFKPQFYVTDSGGSQPSDPSNHSNHSNHPNPSSTKGSIRITGLASDLALVGKGYFIVKSGETGETRYTRDGTFFLNAANQLTAASGEIVQGYGVDRNFNLIARVLGDVTIPLNAAITQKATTLASFQGILNSDGPPASGATVLLGSNWTENGNSPTAATLMTSLVNVDSICPFAANDVLKFSPRKGGQNLRRRRFVVNVATTLGDFTAFLQNALGINTSVPEDPPTGSPPPGVTIEDDLANPGFSHIVIVANSGTSEAITLSQSGLKNQAHGTPMTFTSGSTLAGPLDNPAGESVRTRFTAYDSLGTPLEMDISMVKEAVDSNGTRWRYYVESSENVTDTGQLTAVRTGLITFGTDGRPRAGSTARVMIHRVGVGTAKPVKIRLDFSNVSAFAAPDSSLTMTMQDGLPLGTLSGYSVREDGTITGNFSNGAVRTIGQIALATFMNPQGLINWGDGSYAAGPTSGEPELMVPQAKGVGKIISGALEFGSLGLRRNAFHVKHRDRADNSKTFKDFSAGSDGSEDMGEFDHHDDFDGLNDAPAHPLLYSFSTDDIRLFHAAEADDEMFLRLEAQNSAWELGEDGP